MRGLFDSSYSSPLVAPPPEMTLASECHPPYVHVHVSCVHVCALYTIVTCIHSTDLQVVNGAGGGGVLALSLQHLLVAGDQLGVLAVGSLQEGGRDAL